MEVTAHALSATSQATPTGAPTTRIVTVRSSPATWVVGRLRTVFQQRHAPLLLPAQPIKQANAAPIKRVV